MVDVDSNGVHPIFLATRADHELARAGPGDNRRV